MFWFSRTALGYDGCVHISSDCTLGNTTVGSFCFRCSLYILSFILHSSFFYNCASTERLSQLQQCLVFCSFLFLMWILLWILFLAVVALCFQESVYLYHSVKYVHVLYINLLIQPYRSYRQLCKCYTEWLFNYLVRLLPYIWIIVLLNVTYVVRVVQYFYQTSILHFQSIWQASFRFHSPIHVFLSPLEIYHLLWGRLISWWHLVLCLAQVTFQL